ncbi:MAG: hypothetical protein Q4A82_00175 [Corynebacterium sp.]|nr:hypothetical protein [Corynebacterium sp.]
MRKLSPARLGFVALCTMPLMVGCGMQSLLSQATQEGQSSSVAQESVAASSSSTTSATSSKSTTSTSARSSSTSSTSSASDEDVVPGTQHELANCSVKKSNENAADIGNFMLESGSVADLADNRKLVTYNIKERLPEDQEVKFQVFSDADNYDTDYHLVIEMGIQNNELTTSRFNAVNGEKAGNPKIPSSVDVHVDISDSQVKLFIDKAIASSFGEKSMIKIETGQATFTCSGKSIIR